MNRQITSVAVMVFLTALTALGCGGSPPKATTSSRPHVVAVNCPRAWLETGQLGNPNESAYARIVAARNVGCATALAVAQSWGRHLLFNTVPNNVPAGWRCDGSSGSAAPVSCSDSIAGGSSNVRFTLDLPPSMTCPACGGSDD